MKLTRLLSYLKCTNLLSYTIEMKWRWTPFTSLPLGCQFFSVSCMFWLLTCPIFVWRDFLHLVYSCLSFFLGIPMWSLPCGLNLHPILIHILLLNFICPFVYVAWSVAFILLFFIVSCSALSILYCCIKIRNLVFCAMLKKNYLVLLYCLKQWIYITFLYWFLLCLVCSLMLYKNKESSPQCLVKKFI